MDPLAVGFLWEVFIGLFALIFWLGRRFFFQFSPVFPSKKTMLHIALAASPTALASALLPLAMTLGNPGIVQAVTSASGLIFVFLFGIFFYREHLRRDQVVPILIIICGVIGLRLW